METYLDTKRSNLAVFLPRCRILFNRNTFHSYGQHLPGLRFTFDLNNLLKFKYVPAQLCYYIIFFQLFLNRCCYFYALIFILGNSPLRCDETKKIYVDFFGSSPQKVHEPIFHMLKISFLQLFFFKVKSRCQ